MNLCLTNNFQPSLDLLFNLGSGVGVAHDSITVHYCVPGFDQDNTDDNDGNWDDNNDSGVDGISDEDDAVLNRLLSSAR